MTFCFCDPCRLFTMHFQQFEAAVSTFHTEKTNNQISNVQRRHADIASAEDITVMVLLTMTASIVEGLTKCKPLAIEDAEKRDDAKSAEQKQHDDLDAPAVGNPISHGQIVDLYRQLVSSGDSEYTLESLLRGAKVYVPPPPPKPEPVSLAIPPGLTILTI